MSPDGKTYTFKLVGNATWHDGKPFTAADVLFSVDFLKQTHARARGNLAKVASVTAPDPRTVVFTLSEPFGPFLGIFEVGSLPMIPKHVYEGTDYKTNPANNTRSAPGLSCSRSGRRARSSGWSRTRTTTSPESPTSTRSTGT